MFAGVESLFSYFPTWLYWVAQYAKELEQAGVIIKERGNAAPLTAAEAKALEKKNASLLKEIEHLKEKVSKQDAIIDDKERAIADLTEQLEIERGNTFMKKKAEFASRHMWTKKLPQRNAPLRQLTLMNLCNFG